MQCDIFFSSKGHDAPALYNVLIGLGLLDEDLLHQLRRLRGLPGHPHIETPYVQANTGSLGMGVSKAKGIVLANRLAGIERRVFVLTGDGELQEGQFWESLGSAATRQLGEIVAIIDHNKIQSDTWVQDVSPLGDLEAKLRAFGWHVTRCDGHDVAATRAHVPRARCSDRTVPKAIIADTVKGKGVSFMEGPALKPGELYAYHSGAPKEDAYTRRSGGAAGDGERAVRRAWVSVRSRQKPRRGIRDASRGRRRISSRAYEQALVRQGDRHPNLVALDADLIKDCGLVSFAKRFPDRFIECGIAEQDMVSMAGGMARRGALPVVHSFACFLVGAAERTDLQPVQRGHEGHLRRLACRPDPRRSRPLAPVGARHLCAQGRGEPVARRARPRGRGAGAARLRRQHARPTACICVSCR